MSNVFSEKASSISITKKDMQALRSKSRKKKEDLMKGLRLQQTNFVKKGSYFSIGSHNTIGADQMRSEYL
jgi:hypothetical protein